MRILIVAPYALMPYHHGTDLELAQVHLDAGDDVTFVRCNAELLSCDVNLEHELSICATCVGRASNGLDSLSAPPRTIPLFNLTDADRAVIAALPATARTLDDLKAIKFEEFDIGWAVLSSIVSGLRDPDPDLLANRDLLRRQIVSSAAVYRSIQRTIDEHAIERVYVLNGRLAPLRAVFRAAQSRGIGCHLHERGSTVSRYSLFENHLPHDIDNYQRLVRNAWQTADPEMRELFASSFYADMKLRISHSWYHFGARQSSSVVDEWDARRNNIAVFTSSDDENVAIGDVLLGPIYESQHGGIDDIIAFARGNADAHVYVRMHPNTQLSADARARDLLVRKAPRVTIIAPNSQVDSYALMRSATRVVSFGSTTGIEAAFWGKPSILGMRTAFDQLGSTYAPRTRAEFVSLMGEDVSAKSKEGALAYGYFQRTHGTPFRHFQPSGYATGNFRGSIVSQGWPMRIASRVLRAGGPGLSRVHLKLLENRIAP